MIARDASVVIVVSKDSHYIFIARTKRRAMRRVINERKKNDRVGGGKGREGIEIIRR